jgi:hypothetical protein
MNVWNILGEGGTDGRMEGDGGDHPGAHNYLAPCFVLLYLLHVSILLDLFQGEIIRKHKRQY